MISSKINRSLQTTLCLLFLASIFSRCEENRLQVDTSKINVSIEIERWDSIWFNMSAVSFRNYDAQWREAQPQLYKHYVEDILKVGKLSDSNLFAQIRQFTTDPLIVEVHEKVEEAYSNVDVLESELSNAWKHYAYYFPKAKIPSHVAIEGGFNIPLAVTETSIGIPLEMYLGSSTAYYDYLQIPLYLRVRMTPKHLPIAILKSWLETEHILSEDSPTLLDEIIHQGKILYCLDALFPESGDSLKIFYTGSEVTWAQEHEANVWAHFIDKELLFTTDKGEISKYTREGPFTVDLVKESPARMGHHIGWQIVRAFMDKQETIDLKALLTNTETEQILKQSKYKPS